MGQRICSIDDCGRPHYGRGWCRHHYVKWWKHGDPEHAPALDLGTPCKVDGCERILEPPYGRGMCSLHYQRWKKHGDPHRTRPRRQGVDPCVIDGCDKPIKGRDWCDAHYSRWLRHGSPTAQLRGEVVDGKRICPQCRENKPLDEWTRHRCKECSAKTTAEWRKRNPKPPKVDEIRPCDYCGAWYASNGKNPRFCSTKCAKPGRNKANWKYLNARRARLRAAFVESFDRLEIFERDGWTCGICHQAIDPDVKHPDPMSASLDHIVPIARGGEHSRANAQAAHLTCNVRKADKMIV